MIGVAMLYHRSVPAQVVFASVSAAPHGLRASSYVPYTMPISFETRQSPKVSRIRQW